MSLVDYSSESSEEETQDVSLPIPEQVLDLYQTGPRIDDPSFHENRTRVYPHVEGRWPSHVYLEWMPSDRGLLRGIADSVSMGGELHSFVESELGVPHPLHISLSDTLMIETDEKERFLERMEELKLVKPVTVRVRNQPIVLKNQTNSRWFLALPIEDAGMITKLIGRVNNITRSLGQPELEGDNIHVSIAWFDSDCYDQVAHRVGQLDIEGHQEITFDHIKVKIGRVVHSI
ncbi:hypothetical protein TRVA0_004S01200 [Trichomonascus vanleenenianus]|uniref:phosphoric diester hydrolase n=1 Tax=Trichomonascus vanleenenianus TaxID=2268995 RepID=UPI003ECB468C